MALVSEGVTDDRFLPRLLERSAFEVGSQEFSGSYDVADVIVLRERPGPSGKRTIVELAERNDGAFNILVVHRDMGSSASKTQREWLAPIREAWDESDRHEALALVVPKRETEAWALCDGDAVREVLGVKWDDRRLGLPVRPRDVEAIIDPKAALEAIAKEVSRSNIDFLSRLGDIVSLEKLRLVPSFCEWEDSFRVALGSLAGGR